MLSIALLLTIGPGGTSAAFAQQAEGPPPAALAPAQLDQLVAPVALYPDPLLAQVLVAATYPDDVVQANNWAKQHQNLQGQQLSDAVVAANLPYDPSIVSLIQFPTVLEKLSKEKDWTTKLGNAMLTQRGDVMDAVQRMRRKAEQAGNLKSSEQVKVVSNPTTIEIQPTNPQVIYVPVYTTQVVYAPAPPPPPGPSTGAKVAAGLITFGLGVAVGAAASNNCCWYGGSMAWHSHTVVVANTSYSRTWATRGAMPPPPPYYRAGGPYPVGRAPIPAGVRPVAYGNNNVTVNRNVNVNNNTNVNNVNVNTNRHNTVNRNTAASGNAAATANQRSGAAAKRGGAAASQEARGYSRPADSEKASAFSGAGNGSSEKAASQRGQASARSRQR